MGEQRPNRTAKPFISALVDADIIGKVDPYSEILGGRRWRVADLKPETDVIEFYWAHKLSIANWTTILKWGMRLLLRWPLNVPHKLLTPWLFSWAITIVGVLCLSLSAILFFYPTLVPKWIPKEIPSLGALPVGLTALLLFVQYKFLSYLGDAAVYLDDDPRNISERDEVRKRGVLLLDELHKSKDYDRIVIVGHSLGSVIGYDILSYAWHRVHNRHIFFNPIDQELLAASETLAATLGPEDQTKWAEASLRLWMHQRRAGAPWLVTDFVTLGSPLSHGELLLADSLEKFGEKKRDRELPTCPPTRNKGKFSYVSEFRKHRGAYVMDHASWLAMTRWTNLYFPSCWIFRGDFVGGPIGPAFGPGVRDVKVNTNIRYGWLAHTSYWRIHEGDERSPDGPITQLRKALDLWRSEYNEDISR